MSDEKEHGNAGGGNGGEAEAYVRLPASDYDKMVQDLAEAKSAAEYHLSQSIKATEARAIAEQDTRTAEKSAENLRAEFGDLKQKLHEARLLNARLQGYIARVQEDDVVREPLVTTGEPGGEQRLTPKRRHANHRAPSDFGPEGQQDRSHARDLYTERRQPKHFVRYGE